MADSNTPGTVTPSAPATSPSDPANPVPTLSLAQLTTLNDQAQHIIRTNAAIAAAVGLIPIPGVDVAALTGQQLIMINSLGKLYGQTFSAELGKKAIISLVGSVIPQSSLKYSVFSALDSSRSSALELACLPRPSWRAQQPSQSARCSTSTSPREAPCSPSTPSLINSSSWARLRPRLLLQPLRPLVPPPQRAVAATQPALPASPRLSLRPRLRMRLRTRLTLLLLRPRRTLTLRLLLRLRLTLTLRLLRRLTLALRLLLRLRLTLTLRLLLRLRLTLTLRLLLRLRLTLTLWRLLLRLRLTLTLRLLLRPAAPQRAVAAPQRAAAVPQRAVPPHRPLPASLGLRLRPRLLICLTLRLRGSVHQRPAAAPAAGGGARRSARRDSGRGRPWSSSVTRRRSRGVTNPERELVRHRCRHV